MKWGKIGKKLLFPPLWIMLILTVVSALLLILVFVKGLEESFFAYVVYVLAFYTLSVICIWFWLVLPVRYKKIKGKLYSYPIGERYMTDAVFRNHVALYFSLGVNLLYVGVNILSFILYRSMWFIVLAGYYIILAVMRFLLLRYAKKNSIGENKLGELKRVTLCSSILLTINFVLSGAVLMILYQDRGFEYHGILIYVMAAYAFYITTHTVIDLVKYRKFGSPVMTMSKVIALSAALVSMLSLETAMFSQFGQEMSHDDQWLMIALTGAGVSVIVITMSVYMIVKSTREIRKQEVIYDGK